VLKRPTYIVILLCNVMFFTGALVSGLFLGTKLAHALCSSATSCTDLCSPGIPCTGYDLYTDFNAGHDPNLNGPKTGKAPVDYSESTCDGNFMNQIYSKAYMEGTRQVIMSEQIIHKPDSVMEYTCFQGYVNKAASIESQFSYTSRWDTGYTQDLETDSDTKEIKLTAATRVYRKDFNDNDIRCNATDMADGDECVNDLSGALNYIVSDTLGSYLGGSFSHKYLGEALTIDTSGAPAGCADMATVWSIAKCLDFSEDDRFRTFESLIYADPRSIPQECSPGHTFFDNNDPTDPATLEDDDIKAGDNSTKLDTTGPASASGTLSSLCPPAGTEEPGVNTRFSNDLLRVSNNCSDATGPHAYVEMDLIEFQDYLLLGAGTNSSVYIPGTGGDPDGMIPCADPFPTGIPVITYEHDPLAAGTLPGLDMVAKRRKFVHFEHICPNPGCFYRATKILLPLETTPIPNSTPLGRCVRY